MMKIQVLPIHALGTTREFLAHRISSVERYFIWICFALAIFILGFIFLGKYETTVKASGIIRPETDVSIIKNVLSGKIVSLYYTRGQKVKKGDLLLQILISSQVEPLMI